MFVLIKTAYCMLKKRKIQSILIGLMLMLTTMLLYTGIGIITTDSPYDQMFERAKASHTLLETDEGLYDTNTLVSWWQAQSEVENVNLFPTALVVGPIKIKGRLENESFKVSEFTQGSSFDLLYGENNKPCTEISTGEIWINTDTANDFDIHIGDILSLPNATKTIDFIVTHIIVDPIYSSGMFSPSKVWVSEGTLEKYFKENKHISQIGIRYETYTEALELNVLKNFKKSLPNGFLGNVDLHTRLKKYFTITSDILSALLVLTAILMLFVVMMIIRSTINNVVLNKYKSIGVMKAIGYNATEIVLVFMLQFLILLFLQMPFGMLLGYVVRQKLLLTMTDALHIPVTGNVVIPLVITLVMLISAVTLFTFISAKKAGKVKPVQAIKYGMPESKHYKTSFSISRLPRFPLAALFVLKQVLGNKRHTLFQILVFSTSIFLAVTVLSISTSFNDKNTVMYYVGMASGDMSLSTDESVSYETLMTDLNSMEGVEAAASYEYVDNCSTFSEKLDDYISLYGVIIRGDAQEIGFKIKTGHFPSINNEVLITQYVADESNKAFGDYIEIQTPSGPKKYLISGIYETVFNNGQEFVISSSLNEEDIINASNTAIKLNLSDNYRTVEEKIKKKYADNVGIEKEDFASKSLKNTTQKVTSILLYVSVIFLIVCAFAIFNWTLMDIKNSSKMYGILKANGMSNFKIIRILLFKSWFITLAGCAIGIVMSMLLAAPLLIYFISFGFKLTSFVITVPFNLALLISLLFIATSTISTLIPGLRIGKITPRILIVE